MTLNEVMAELKSFADERTLATFRRHGAKGDFFGVKVGDLKTILKKIKGDQALALELWDSENGDARYLAGMAADGSQMTRKQLDDWCRSATGWGWLAEYSVPGVASEHDAAFELAKKWMNMKSPERAACGWNTYTARMSIRPDDELDLDEIRDLMKRVEAEIGGAPNRVRYCMNGFLIAVAIYVKPLLKEAKAVAKRIGVIEVDMGDTACKVPIATDAIAKAESKSRIGKKRKTAKC